MTLIEMRGASLHELIIATVAAWKYAKLIEVTVSGDQNDPNAPGSVDLVKDGWVVVVILLTLD